MPKARQTSVIGSPLEHDPEKWIPVSEKIMLQQ
jgi:hypothetical protein